MDIVLEINSVLVDTENIMRKGVGMFEIEYKGANADIITWSFV